MTFGTDSRLVIAVHSRANTHARPTSETTEMFFFTGSRSRSHVHAETASLINNATQHLTRATAKSPAFSSRFIVSVRDVCFLGCACECSPTEEPILPTRPTHRPFGPVGYTRITSAYIYLYSWHLSTRFHIHTPETFSKKEKKETRTTSKTKKKLTITPYNIVTYQHRLLKVELGLGWPLCKLIFNIHSIYSHYISTIRKRHGLSIDILLQV